MIYWFENNSEFHSEDVYEIFIYRYIFFKINHSRKACLFFLVQNCYLFMKSKRKRKNEIHLKYSRNAVCFAVVHCSLW